MGLWYINLKVNTLYGPLRNWASSPILPNYGQNSFKLPLSNPLEDNTTETYLRLDSAQVDQMHVAGEGGAQRAVGNQGWGVRLLSDWHWDEGMVEVHARHVTQYRWITIGCGLLILGLRQESGALAENIKDSKGPIMLFLHFHLSLLCNVAVWAWNT